MQSCTALPPGAGLGLKPEHAADVLSLGRFAGRGSPLCFLEVHPQNFFGDGGPPHRLLTECAAHFPLSFHSVGLSLGRAQGCDGAELDQLAALCDRYQPAEVSDHLAWCSTGDARFPDLLPLPLTETVLDHFAGEVSRVQDRLKRRILIENPSRMLAFAGDTMTEAAFLSALALTTGCGLLLDINNIVVSAINLGLSPHAILAATDPALVAEIHIAGHAIEAHESGPLAIDDHGSAVGELCWRLLDDFLQRAGPRPVLLERDSNVPPFAAVFAELEQADARIASVSRKELPQPEQTRAFA